MKKLLQFFPIFLLSLPVFAQSDSITVTDAKWGMQRLSKGVIWKTMHFKNNTLFGANQYINLLELAADTKKVRPVLAYSDSLERTSDMAKNHKAIAGINGSFFKMRGADPDYRPDLKSVPKSSPSKIDKNRSTVYLRVSDSLISEHTFARDSVRKRHQKAVIAIKDSKLLILAADQSNLFWERSLVAEDIVSSGPLLLLKGVGQPIPDDPFCNDRHPRTAVGIKPDGTVLLLVVDGRLKEAGGMSIPELQKTMRWLGCSDALNLDGGGSSAMYIKGEPDNGVVNHPSDNKKFDHGGEREVANALLLLKP